MSQISDIVNGLIRSGLTQTEIAKQTGIPQPRLSRWANGEAPDSADDVLTLARLAESRAAELATPTEKAA